MSAPGPQEPESGAEPLHESPEAAAEARAAEADARTEQHRGDLLRAIAELDNVRKRAAREVDAARLYGVERFAGELLPVADSLALALETAATADAATLREGQGATLRLLMKAFERAGLEEFDPAGQPFDPTRQEAMATRPSGEHPAHTVIQVVQRGWLLNGRLLRPARVIVSVAPEVPAGPATG